MVCVVQRASGLLWGIRRPHKTVPVLMRSFTDLFRGNCSREIIFFHITVSCEYFLTSLNIL